MREVPGARLNIVQFRAGPYLKMITKEKPIYVLKQTKKREIIPRISLLVVLSIIFYVGILVNLSLVNVPLEQENMVKLGALVVLITLFVIALILTIIKSSKSYIFLQDRIVFGRKKMLYQEITNTKMKKNILDKLFKTYSIHLGNKFYLRNISDSIELENYFKKLIKYAKAKEPKL